MSMLIFISLMISFSMFLIKHPLSMGVLLLTQTLMFTLISNLINYFSWFSYILFLIMISGMLILYMYMTSIASNEKFNFYIKMNYLILIIFFMIIIYLLFNEFLLNYKNLNMELLNNNYMFLNKFNNFPYYNIMLLMMIYLFITLIMSVKICNLKMGPLRQKI